MDNNGKIRVNLSTVIFMFIIFVLIVVIFGMWYYYNVIKDYNLDNNKSDSVEASNIAKNEDSSLNNIASENNAHESLVNIKLGSYVVKPDKNILGDISDISGEENITFSEDNKFSAYIGFGNTVAGNYTITDENIINCTIDTFVGEYSPEQKTSGNITLKIIDDSTVEVIDVSESVDIRMSELTNDSWSLTDEHKDIGLRPFEKGVKFVFSD